MADILGQDAYGPSDKPQRGFQQGLLQGYVFSPRFRRAEGDWGLLGESMAAGDALLDPETYLLRLPADRLRYLPEWPYWSAMARGRVWDGPIEYAAAVPAMLEQQVALGFTTVVAGGPLLPSLYGFEAAIQAAAMSAASTWQTASGFAGDMLAGLAIGDSALRVRPENAPGSVHEDIALWLDRATRTPGPGFYIVVDWENEAYSMPQDPIVLSNLMYLVHALAETNSRRVVVGYTGLWALLPIVAGASAVATGWYLSGRRMSTSKFLRQGMARQARSRVWLRDILAEVTDDVLPLLCRDQAAPPDASQTYLVAQAGGTPQCLQGRAEEVLHNWAVLGQLAACLAQPTAAERTAAFGQMLDAAKAFFSTYCRSTGETIAATAHLDGWRAAVQRFRRMAGFD